MVAICEIPAATPFMIASQIKLEVCLASRTQSPRGQAGDFPIHP